MELLKTTLLVVHLLWYCLDFLAFDPYSRVDLSIDTLGLYVLVGVVMFLHPTICFSCFVMDTFSVTKILCIEQCTRIGDVESRKVELPLNIDWRLNNTPIS